MYACMDMYQFTCRIVRVYVWSLRMPFFKFLQMFYNISPPFSIYSFLYTYCLLECLEFLKFNFFQRLFCSRSDSHHCIRVIFYILCINHRPYAFLIPSSSFSSCSLLSPASNAATSIISKRPSYFSSFPTVFIDFEHCFTFMRM